MNGISGFQEMRLSTIARPWLGGTLAASPWKNVTPINDCHGHQIETMVDNIEDVDKVVGWLAEFPRAHGFAISETQFQVFILNASRRLFSDRFFTSIFRPEFYTKFGVDWSRTTARTARKWNQTNRTTTRSKCHRSSACCSGPSRSWRPSSITS
jgi:hypothetical protein